MNPLPLHASPQIADVEGLNVRLSNSSQKYSTPLTLLPFPHLPSRKVSCNSLNTCRGWRRKTTVESQLREPHCPRPGCHAPATNRPSTPSAVGCKLVAQRRQVPISGAHRSCLIWPVFVDAVKLRILRWRDPPGLSGGP